jgi:signal peptidase II
MLNWTRPMMGSRKWVLLAVSLAVLIADQATKWAALKWLEYGKGERVVDGFFSLSLTFNKGIAFGVLSDLPDLIRHILIAAATLAALATLIYFMVWRYHADFAAGIALAMIFGGAVGNIIDRLRFGKVVDFLDFYYSSFHWPAFNIADSAVCIGVCVLLLRPSKKVKSGDS